VKGRPSWIEFLRLEADLALTFIEAALNHSDQSKSTHALGSALTALAQIERSLKEPAAYGGHPALAELLIRHGAPLNTPASEQRDYPLHLAAACGNSELIEVLISHRAEIDAPDRSGNTPLHLAAEGNSRAAVRLLVAAGADLEARDSVDWWSATGTPLQHAICGGSPAVVHEFVQFGADVNAETIEKPRLAFRILGEYQWPLVDVFDGTRPLHMAVCRGWRYVVELLLDHGADINALSFGWSALHAAVAIPDPDMAELLIGRGADPYVKAELKSRRGPEWNHHTPMDLLRGFQRSAQLLRDAQQKSVPLDW
jgi:ankyrin repeat protein